MAFIDDLLLAISDSDNASDVIRDVKELFGYIGLDVNAEKCKCTRDEDITFMGVTFSHDKQEVIPLAPQLQIKAQELIDQMQTLLKYFTYVVVTSVNYGAFLDFA